MTKKASDIIDIFAAAMLEQKKLREERESAGVPALLKLVKAAKEGGGQAHHLRHHPQARSGARSPRLRRPILVCPACAPHISPEGPR